MTPELQHYYESRFKMMAEDGWRDLMVDVERMLESTNRIDDLQDEKSLHFRRGEVSIMRWLLSLESISREIYEGMQNAKTDA